MKVDTRKTKECPFCAEIIQARAIKCRYCNEYLNINKATSLRKIQPEDEEAEQEEPQSDDILFEAGPSLFGMLGFAVKAILLGGIGVVILALPLASFTQDFAQKTFEYQLSDSVYNAIITYKMILGLGIIIFALLLILCKAIKLKTMFYQVSTDRIEYRRGIFDRRVDNIDMFRIVDLRMRRTLIDCILGIGSVGLITNDRTDPEFEFEKIRHSRKLYDILKVASLEADTARGVVHLE